VTPVRSCLYCESAAGDLPQAVVYEDREVVAFLDWRQSAPGHVLVVPRRHMDADELFASETGAALLRAVRQVARAVRRALAPDGLQMGAIVYPAAGMRGSGLPHAAPLAGDDEEETAEDHHFHLHLLPRRSAGEVARIFPFGDAVEPAERLAELARRIRAALVAEALGGTD
jgi:diadenosine tetraphosphate (Ap4A) HIT family hydrolase